MTALSQKECVPCRGGVPPLNGKEIAKLLPELNGWEVINEHHLTKHYKFENFLETLAFVNRVGELAEEQGPSSGLLFRIWKGAGHDLDSQDRWTYRE